MKNNPSLLYSLLQHSPLVTFSLRILNTHQFAGSFSHMLFFVLMINHSFLLVELNGSFCEAFTLENLSLNQRSLILFLSLGFRSGVQTASDKLDGLRR